MCVSAWYTLLRKGETAFVHATGHKLLSSRCVSRHVTVLHAVCASLDMVWSGVCMPVGINFCPPDVCVFMDWSCMCMHPSLHGVTAHEHVSGHKLMSTRCVCVSMCLSCMLCAPLS